MKPLYLDNAASTPLLEEVKKTMLEVMNDSFGNSSSVHSLGVDAVKKVEKAREIIARSLNAQPEEIYFTSGGTESNNWVIQSVVKQGLTKRKKIVTSEIEHPSILAPLMWVQEKFGIEVVKVGVDSEGRVRIPDLEAALKDDVLLCTLMHVNNEVGSIQPIEIAAKLCLKHGIAFHVDACQGYIKVPLDLKVLELTYLTINAHKLHGPKGIGALYMKKGHELDALFHGGGHEMNRRSGTLNVPAIAGFGKAVELQSASLEKFVEMKKLLNWLSDELTNHFSNYALTGADSERAPHILNIRFKGFLGKDIFWALNKAKIAVSTSSACSSNKLTPSHVLKAMGFNDESNLEALRISIGLQTTKDDLQLLINELKGIIK